MADPKVDQLKRVPIFSACSKAELQWLAQNTDEVSLPAQRTLISVGKSNDTFYILLEGEAVATVNGQERRMGPGDIFGEISMLDRGKATATITTGSPVKALVMSHAQFRDAVRTHEDIALRVISVMAERLRRSNQAGV